MIKSFLHVHPNDCMKMTVFQDGKDPSNRRKNHEMSQVRVYKF